MPCRPARRQLSAPLARRSHRSSMPAMHCPILPIVAPVFARLEPCGRHCLPTSAIPANRRPPMSFIAADCRAPAAPASAARSGRRFLALVDVGWNSSGRFCSFSRQPPANARNANAAINAARRMCAMSAPFSPGTSPLPRRRRSPRYTKGRPVSAAPLAYQCSARPEPTSPTSAHPFSRTGRDRPCPSPRLRSRSRGVTTRSR